MWPAEKAVSAIYRGPVETPAERAERLAREQNNLRWKLAAAQKEKDHMLERFDAVNDLNHNLILRLGNLRKIISGLQKELNELQKELNECENNPVV